MRLLVITALLLAFLTLSAAGADIDLIFRHGEPIKDPKAAWAGHIEYASWIDDERIVYWSRGDVTCISTKTRQIQWVVRGVGKISDWSVSRDMKRLAILAENDTTSVIDCNSGKVIFTANRTRMSKMLGLDFTIPSRLAFVHNDGRLIICMFSTFYGRNAYILDASYEKTLTSFDIDALPRNISVSPEGSRVAVIAKDDVLCVRDLHSNRDVFFRGKRITEKPDTLTSAIDAPFYSHFRDSGRELLIYTLDNSWATGKVFVHNIKTTKINSFDGRNGHIELDVSFPTRQLVVTGTSTDLTVLDFDGHVITHKKNVTTQRNASVEFSPLADRILVGSWDNTLSVFSITEKGK
tara:strand:- start:3517 stop:4569 length:1053 start_codon:yes stop_codon:yes gene_type:complete